MLTQVSAIINPITREIEFEQSNVSSVELDGGLWTMVFKIPIWFGQNRNAELDNTNYAVTVNYSQNNPILNDDGFTDYIDNLTFVEDGSWPYGGYIRFTWVPPLEASQNKGWLYFNVRIRDRQTNGVWSTKTKKIRVNPVVIGGSSSSLTPTQSDKIDEMLDAYPVAYGKEQSLSAKEKYRARTNIGVFGSSSDPVPIRLRAEKQELDETVGYVNFLRGPSPEMLSADFGSFNKPLAEIAMRIYQGSPVQLVINSGDNRTILPDICTSDYSLGNPESVVFHPTSVTGSSGPTGDWYPDDKGMLMYSEDDPTLSVRFECHDPIVYKNVAVAKYKEYTYTPRESSTSITENLLVVEFSHEDLESAVVTVSGTNNSVASMDAFEIFEAVQNGKNVVLHWPMPNFDDGYYSCKLENSYKSGTAQAHAWFTTIIGNDLHWYTIDGDGNARASTVVPLGGSGSGTSVVKNLVIVDESGNTPIASMTSAQIKDIYDLGGTVILRYKDSLGSVVDYLLKCVYTDSQGSFAEFYDTWTFKTSYYTHIFVDHVAINDNGEVTVALGGKSSLPNPDKTGVLKKFLMSDGTNYVLADQTLKIVIGDDGSLPTEYPTVNAILSEIRAGRSVVGYWWMTDQHLDEESYVLLYPTEPTLGQQASLELTGTYWHGTQRRMVIMSGQGTDDTLTISFVDIPSNNKERDSQIVTPSGNVPTTETTIYTHTITNAGHYLITANACGQYTSTTVDRALTLTIKVNGTVKAQTISTSASSWYAECALSINEELSKNDVVTVTVVSSKDSLAVKGVWHAGICQLC